MIEPAIAAMTVTSFTAFFVRMMPSGSASPILKDSTVDAPVENIAVIAPISVTIGPKKLIDDSASAPTRFPATRPSTVVSRSVDIFVAIIAGRNSRSFVKVRLPLMR